MLPSEKLDNHMGVPEAQESIAKVTFSAIPYIGPILNELFFEFPNRIKQKRVNELVNILKNKIENIETQIVTEEYLLSEDFFDISALVFENTTRIRSEERREALAKLYIISLQKSIDFDTSIYRIFVDFIVELKELQIVILKYIQIYQDELVEIETYPKFIEKIYLKFPQIEIGDYEFKYFVIDLENKGLITLEDGLDDFSSNSELVVDENHKSASVKLTSFGEKFLKYLINN